MNSNNGESMKETEQNAQSKLDWQVTCGNMCGSEAASLVLTVKPPKVSDLRHPVVGEGQ